MLKIDRELKDAVKRLEENNEELRVDFKKPLEPLMDSVKSTNIPAFIATHEVLNTAIVSLVDGPMVDISESLEKVNKHIANVEAAVGE